MKNILMMLALALPVAGIAQTGEVEVVETEPMQVEIPEMTAEEMEMVVMAIEEEIEQMEMMVEQIEAMEAVDAEEIMMEEVMMEEMMMNYDFKMMSMKEIAQLYYDGKVMYDELPEYIQQRVLSIDGGIFETYEPTGFDPNRRVVIPTKRMGTPKIMTRSQKDARSYRDTQSSKLRTFNMPKYGKNPFRQSNSSIRRMPNQKDREMNQKSYMVRRSYYYFDKRDEQTADYVRLRNRIRMMNPPSDMVYSEDEN